MCCQSLSWPANEGSSPLPACYPMRLSYGQAGILPRWATLSDFFRTGSIAWNTLSAGKDMDPSMVQDDLEGPPAIIRGCGDLFWLLPGIYHAHAFGLTVLLAFITGGMCWRFVGWYGYCRAIWAGLFLAQGGIVFIISINVHYLRRFRAKWRDPSEVKAQVE